MTRSSDFPVIAKPQARLLLVDDDISTLRACARMLRKAGYHVDTADNGQAAADSAGNNSYDAIISDISMPHMNGIELLQFIRDVDDDVPMILITGAPAVETAVQALDYGAYKYLVKPVTSERLEEVVQKAVHLRQMAQIRRQAVEVLQGSASDATLKENFQRALDGLWMAYQPIVTNTGQLYGHEALLRSNEPSLPHPGAVLDAAEKLDQLHLLGRKLRRCAAAPVQDQPNAGVLFVNVHPQDLEDEDLVWSEAPLAQLASTVVLEITERASLNSVQHLRKTVQLLKQAGYRIAVDDLGAGYAGLSSFALLEPDIVKIDMTLVRDVDTQAVKQRLIASITSLCREMGIMVVGEGVETRAERDVLIDLGCDLFQGYFIAKPDRPFPEFTW